MRRAHRRRRTARSPCSTTPTTARAVGRGARRLAGATALHGLVAGRAARLLLDAGRATARRRARHEPGAALPPADADRRRRLDRGLPVGGSGTCSARRRAVRRARRLARRGLPPRPSSSVLPLLRRARSPTFAPRRAAGDRRARPPRRGAGGGGRRRRATSTTSGRRCCRCCAELLGVGALSAGRRRPAAALAAGARRRRGRRRRRARSTRDDARSTSALGALYERRRARAASAPRRRASRAGSATSASTSRQAVVQVMQHDAIERLDLRQLLLEPELLDAVEPDVAPGRRRCSRCDRVMPGDDPRDGPARSCARSSRTSSGGSSSAAAPGGHAAPRPRRRARAGRAAARHRLGPHDPRQPAPLPARLAHGRPRDADRLRAPAAARCAT